MPSVADTLLSDAVEQVLDQYGESVTYTPAAGAPKTIVAIVARETRAPEFDEQIVNQFNTMEVTISARSNTEGHVTPLEFGKARAPDSVTIDGATWKVRRVLERNLCGMHRLLLSDGGD